MSALTAEPTVKEDEDDPAWKGAGRDDGGKAEAKASKLEAARNVRKEGCRLAEARNRRQRLRGKPGQRGPARSLKAHRPPADADDQYLKGVASWALQL